MIVKAMAQSDAKDILDARNRGDDVNTEPLSVETGTGEPLADSVIGASVSVLQEVQKTHSGESRPDDPVSAARFDSEASVALHRSLTIDQTTAGNAGFWTWLAVTQFNELIEWRHSRGSQGAHFRNYGVGNKWSNLLPRLWFRAELSIDRRAEDPYRLTRRGNVDFWESGIIRARYSSCRSLTRAFVRVQYPDERPDLPTLHPSNPKGIRELWKRLKRLQATISYEFIDEDGAIELIQDLATDLRRSDRSVWQRLTRR